ncbi:MAG TPA: phosphoribosylanthranilate isomerase [bacterium]|nr:phosphoribosylanthranilate isomerase [bacterium]
MLVKVCGITNRDDALFCARAGADVLGFVFAESPRQVTPETAAGIVALLPANIRKAGVFVNERPEAVKAIARQCALDLIQLHGDETPDECARYAADGFTVIKAIRVKNGTSARDVERYRAADMILLDQFREGIYGGTGEQFDWRIAADLAKTGRKIVLSGGLGPDNVGQAVRTVRPFAVDASSRLELSPGRKDHALVEAFINNAREAAQI